MVFSTTFATNKPFFFFKEMIEMKAKFILYKENG